MATPAELVEQLAAKYHVDKKVVEKAVYYQFKFVAAKMKEEGLPEIRLPYFGVFKPTKRALKKQLKNTNNGNTE